MTCLYGCLTCHHEWEDIVRINTPDCPKCGADGTLSVDDVIPGFLAWYNITAALADEQFPKYIERLPVN